MIVIDASVAAKWYLPEKGSDAAVELQEGPDQLFAPDLIRMEVAGSITRRVREIGIRMALGAVKGDVVQMIVGQGLRLAVMGVATGAVSAVILTRVLSGFSHLLYGVRATDPTTLIAVSLLLIGAAGLACYIPARRAARLDPVAALRQD